MSLEFDAQRIEDEQGRWWVFPDGTKLPVFEGGSEEPAPDPAPEPDPEPEDDLGEKGKKALAAERGRAKEAEKARKAAEKEAAELKDRLEKLEASSKSEGEKALDKARKEAAEEGRKAAMADVHQHIIKAEVRVAAAGRLADAEDAVRFLDLDDFQVDADGEVDSKAIAKAIDELLSEKPYLSGDKKPKKSADGGKRSSTEKDEPSSPRERLRRAYAETGSKT